MDDSTFNHTPTQSNPNPNHNPILTLPNQPTSKITPLEQQVLDEYTRLLENMNKMSATLSTLASGPMTTEIADGLRLLERKVTSVYTLMKASVYSIVLQQGQIDSESGVGDDGVEGYVV